MAAQAPCIPGSLMVNLGAFSSPRWSVAKRRSPNTRLLILVQCRDTLA